MYKPEHVLQGLHEDLLHLLCASSSSCSLPKRHRQLLRLWNGRQGAQPHLAPSPVEGGEEISESARLPGNAAGAPLQSNPAPL